MSLLGKALLLVAIACRTTLAAKCEDNDETCLVQVQSVVQHRSDTKVTQEHLQLDETWNALGAPDLPVLSPTATVLRGYTLSQQLEAESGKKYAQAKNFVKTIDGFKKDLKAMKEGSADEKKEVKSKWEKVKDNKIISNLEALIAQGADTYTTLSGATGVIQKAVDAWTANGAAWTRVNTEAKACAVMGGGQVRAAQASGSTVLIRQTANERKFGGWSFQTYAYNAGVTVSAHYHVKWTAGKKYEVVAAEGVNIRCYAGDTHDAAHEIQYLQKVDAAKLTTPRKFLKAFNDHFADAKTLPTDAQQLAATNAVTAANIPAP